MDNLDLLTQSSEPWVVYRTMLDLLGMHEDDESVIAVKKQMLGHPLVQGLIKELQEWPGLVLSSHKSAGQLYHKLAFLADLGLTDADDGIPQILSSVKAHHSEEGLFQLPMNISPSHGGSGEEQWAWALCDAPLLLYSVKKMRKVDAPVIMKAVAHLLALRRENGWPCAVSKELGKFRGPGRKDDPCPCANLLMLKLLALFPEYTDGKDARIGAETLLELWDNSEERHPYMFFMGTDFRKLKAPFIWYDIMHVAEVLSQYEFTRSDERLQQMVAFIDAKADQEGLFTPESEWMAWKGWDFGQKKQPSAWLTFLVYRINKRMQQIKV